MKMLFFYFRRSLVACGLSVLLAGGLLVVGGAVFADKPLPGELFSGKNSFSDNSRTANNPRYTASTASANDRDLWNVVRPTHGFWASPYAMLIRPICSIDDTRKNKVIVSRLRVAAESNQHKFLSLMLAVCKKSDISAGQRRGLLLQAGGVVNNGGESGRLMQQFTTLLCSAFSQPTLDQAGYLANEFNALMHVYSISARPGLVYLAAISWANLAELQVRAGQFNQATKSLKTAQQQSSLLPSALRVNMRNQLRRVAALVKDANAFAKVLPFLERKLAKYPNSSKVNTRLATESLALLENVPLASQFAARSHQKWLRQMAADYGRIKVDGSSGWVNLAIAQDLAHVGMAQWHSGRRFAICSFAHRSLGRILISGNLSDIQSIRAEKLLSSLAQTMIHADPARHNHNAD